MLSLSTMWLLECFTRGQEEIKAILIANFIHHSIKVVYVADEFYDEGDGMLLIIFNL